MLLIGNGLVVYLIGIWAIYLVLASSLNLLLGYTGLFNMATSIFFGIGAYTSAILASRFGISFWACWLAAGIMAAAVGAIVGYPALRTRGLYFAIVTFAFLWIGTQVMTNWRSITGGPNGIGAIPNPNAIGTITFDSTRAKAALIVVFALVIFYIINRIARSRVGRVFIAIRENEVLAQSGGFNVAVYKLASFVLASFFAGIAGSLYAHFITFISPDSFGLDLSLFILAMVAIGGAGTVWGPAVGAMIFTFLPEYIRGPLDPYRFIIFSLVFLLLMIFIPKGIVGSISEIWAKRRRAKVMKMTT